MVSKVLAQCNGDRKATQSSLLSVPLFSWSPFFCRKMTTWNTAQRNRVTHCVTKIKVENIVAPNIYLPSDGNGRHGTPELTKTTQPFKTKRILSMEGEKRKANKDNYRKRDKTRVNLGRAFALWREPRDFRDNMQFVDKVTQLAYLLILLLFLWLFITSRSLRSSYQDLLVVPRTVALSLWNAPPTDIKSVELYADAFENKWKSHLFKLAFV